ncbi:MAG: 50S ribosomal protein L9 [Lachnospiraceae bacterium]
MKVILLNDIKNLGKKGDIVEASDAYARNVLIGKKQALEATSKNLNDLKLHTKNDERIADEILKDAQKLAAELKEMKVELKIKTGEGGRTFGSVSTKEISQAVKEQLKLDLDKKKMQLDEPIRTIGTHEVAIRLHPKVTGTLRVQVSEE